MQIPKTDIKLLLLLDIETVEMARVPTFSQRQLANQEDTASTAELMGKFCPD
jgi:hypothetical protein